MIQTQHICGNPLDTWYYTSRTEQLNRSSNSYYKKNNCLSALFKILETLCIYRVTCLNPSLRTTHFRNKRHNMYYTLKAAHKRWVLIWDLNMDRLMQSGMCFERVPEWGGCYGEISVPPVLCPPWGGLVIEYFVSVEKGLTNWCFLLNWEPVEVLEFI